MEENKNDYYIQHHIHYVFIGLRKKNDECGVYLVRYNWRINQLLMSKERFRFKKKINDENVYI